MKLEGAGFELHYDASVRFFQAPERGALAR